MAYDELLADRIRHILKEKQVPFEDKKMMGGICFMVDGKMCVGIAKQNLMARVGPDQYDLALSKEGCKEMDFTGRPMKGFVFIEAEAVDMDEQLEEWIQLCLNYNPIANASKKKK